MIRHLGFPALAAMLLLPLLAGGCRERPVDTTDQSTPHAAVHSLVHVIDQRDADEIARFFIIDTDDQRRFAEAKAQLLAATHHLHARALARFGRDDARQLAGASGPSPDHFRRFTEPGAEEVVENDRARLVSSTGEVLELRRDNGRWKIIPTADDEQMTVAESAAVMAELAQLLNDVADGIAAGQIRDVAEARRTIARQTWHLLSASQ